MAAAAVRYLRSAGAPTVAGPVEALPRPDLRAVGEDERAPVDPVRFRYVLGHFATGVTVVTAPAAGPDDPAGPAGFACQSFASLSLDPPLICFMVGRTSTTWPRIARRRRVLRQRTRRAPGRLVPRLRGERHGQVRRGGPRRRSGVRLPRLAGAAAWIDCTIHAVHTGEDHLIVVGRVDALGVSGDGDEDAEVPPLLFHKGRFLT